MGWEPRTTSGRMYFYEATRGPDGRVVKVYVGTGDRAHAAEAAAEARRDDREAVRRSIGAEAARTAGAEELTARVVDAAALVAAAALLANGWHRPNYGPWRRKRT